MQWMFSPHPLNEKKKKSKKQNKRTKKYQKKNFVKTHSNLPRFEVFVTFFNFASFLSKKKKGHTLRAEMCSSVIILTLFFLGGDIFE